MNTYSWVALVGLGAYHGINPAMGWLFAVSQGMQHRSRRAVLRALGPIALGHELSIALVAVVVLVAASSIDTRVLHVGAAALLIAFGLFRFWKPRAHPRWTTMRVSGRELTLWSFLMSSAHGAGLMVAPVLIGAGASTASADDHGATHLGLSSALAAPEAAVGILLHVAAMLAVMGVVAVVVYEKVGVEILRKAWINTDGIWAGAFILAGVITLLT
jgi:hypothetical protein